MGTTIRSESSGSISGLTQIIGNPIQLNKTCDPDHRISLKMKKFMTMMDLIPVDWSLQLNAFTATSEQKQKDNMRGAMKYEFKQPILAYEKRCIKYGLSPASCLRVLINSDTVYTENFSNKYDENKFNNALNTAGSFARQSKPYLQSAGLSSQQVEQNAKQMMSKLPETSRVFDQIEQGYGSGLAQLAKDILFKGRSINLPKIYTGSDYEPSLQASLKLISPYGSSKSIQKWVLEPLIYFLLLSCPDTVDGVSYGGSSLIKAKIYGVADINIGYITDISIRRGGQEMITNRFGQPLSIDITFTIRSLIGGFACINGDSKIQPVQVDSIDDSFGLNEFINPKLDIPIEHDYGMITVDNIINSFKKRPFSDIDPSNINNGSFGGNPMTMILNNAQGAMSGAVSGVVGELRNVRQSVGDAVTAAAVSAVM